MVVSDTEVVFEIMPLYKYQPCPGDDEKKRKRVRQILERKHRGRVFILDSFTKNQKMPNKAN